MLCWKVTVHFVKIHWVNFTVVQCWPSFPDAAQIKQTTIKGCQVIRIRQPVHGKAVLPLARKFVEAHSPSVYQYSRYVETSEVGKRRAQLININPRLREEMDHCFISPLAAKILLFSSGRAKEFLLVLKRDRHATACFSKETNKIQSTGLKDIWHGEIWGKLHSDKANQVVRWNMFVGSSHTVTQQFSYCSRSAASHWMHDPGPTTLCAQEMCCWGFFLSWSALNTLSMPHHSWLWLPRVNPLKGLWTAVASHMPTWSDECSQLERIAETSGLQWL